MARHHTPLAPEFAATLCIGALALFLPGCAAVALAPLVPLVGGMGGASHKVTIDQSSVTGDVRQTLAVAKRLAVLGSDPSVTYMAEYLERHAGYEVDLRELTKGATPSQRRRAMQSACGSAERPDAVLSTSTGDSDAGTGTTVKGVLTGRANYTITGTLDVFGCRTGAHTALRAAIEISQGVYNVDSSRVAQIVGHEGAKAIMTVAGKAVPAQ